HAENFASIRVLEKLGFLTERRDTIMGMNSIVFSLSANDSVTDSCFRHRLSLDWTRGDLHGGLRCFHSGSFFNADEHWESVWLTAQEPLDNMDQRLDYDSAAKASGLNFLVGYELAQQDQPPAWNKGDFWGSTFGPKHSESGLAVK